MTDIELIIPKGITLSEFIDSIEQSIHTVDDYIADLISYFDINTAVGNDIDNIGEILGLKRNDGNSDEEYRNRLLTHISVINEKPTGQSIIDAADRILGFQPSILEYPAFDFTSLTGKTHPGILINFTVAQLNAFADEIEEFGNDVRRIKAAGVATFVGHLKSLIENYAGPFDDSQLLFGAGFTDKTNAIYTGKFDTTVFDYGKFEDETHFIDEFITPLATKLLTEDYIGSLVDEISFVGTLNLTETYSGSLVDTISHVGVLSLNESYLASLIDTIAFTGIKTISEIFSATPLVTSSNKMASTFDIGFSSVGFAKVGAGAGDIGEGVVGGDSNAGGKFGFAQFDDPNPHLVIIEEYN